MNKVVSSKIFNSLDNYLFTRQVRYVKRTHPNKPKYWTKKRYWGRLNLQKPQEKWVFGNKESGNYMLKFSWTKISRHPIVSKRNSPDDPSLKEYWEKRRKIGNKTKAKNLNKKQEYIAYKQGYKCPICGESLFNDEPLNLHHITPKSQGGKDDIDNLVWLHLYCHHKTHYDKK